MVLPEGADGGECVVDAYSVKHITYKWQNGPTNSVSLADEVQLPQVQVKGYRVREKLEVLSTGSSFSLCSKYASKLGFSGTSPGDSRPVKLTGRHVRPKK